MEQHSQLISEIKEENTSALQNHWSAAGVDFILHQSWYYGYYLHYAASQGFVKVLELFLDMGMDIDLRNSFAETPLSVAVGSKQLEAVLTLLDYGALLSFCNYESILYHEPSHFATYSSVNASDSNSLDAQCEEKKSHCIDKILVKHIAKVQSQTQSANVYEGYFEGTHVPGQLKGFHQKCKQELMMMKTAENIDEISMFDFFTKDADQLARCKRNVKIVEAFKSSDYKVKFPMYEELIARHLNRIVEMRNFLDQCEYYLTVLFPQFPIVCIDVVLGMLSIADAKKVVRVFQSEM